MIYGLVAAGLLVACCMKLIPEYSRAVRGQFVLSTLAVALIHCMLTPWPEDAWASAFAWP